VTENVVAAAIDKELSLPEVAFLTGGPGKFHESEFNFGVAADGLDAFLPEGHADMVCDAACDLNHLVVTVGTEPGYGCLQEVSVVVELVSPFQVGVARLLAGSA
ncbi:hypothetical protein ABQG64_04465, partial [Escherichia coli]